MRFEIRRLHDAYKYTTIYVTHDQAEAMTTADTIVVMNLGRVEQVGSPEDIYQRPRSEFVARFIGGTNIFRGRHIGDGMVDCGAARAALRRRRTGRGGRNGGVGAAARHRADRRTARPRPSERRTKPRARSCGSPISARIATISSPRTTAQRCASTAPLQVNVPVGGSRAAAFPAGALPCAGALSSRSQQRKARRRHESTLSAACSRPSRCWRRRVPASAAAPAPTAITPDLLAKAKNEGKIVWYTSIELQTAEKIAKAFEAAYPGIDVQVERNGCERIVQRIEQERGSNIHAADVVECSDMTRAARLEERGLARCLRARPTSPNTRPTIATRTGFTPPTALTLSPIGYNTKLVKPEDAPKSYADLLVPKWKGKIVKAHPGYSGTIMTVTFEISRDLGWDYLRRSSASSRSCRCSRPPTRRKRWRRASARSRRMAANTCRCR